MKNLLAIPVGLLLTTVISAGCNKKDHKLHDVSFFTRSPQRTQVLYINNVEKGTLDYFATEPQCGQQFSKDGPQPLKLQLPSGTYAISGRNAQGQITSSAEVTLSEQFKGVSGRLGGTSVTSTASCVIIGLSE
jgi:hypothetical protein